MVKSKFDILFESIMHSLILEATLEKMSKADQEAVKSGDAEKIEARIEFYEKALKGDVKQPNGKPYKEKTAQMYIDFLQKKLDELSQQEQEEPSEEPSEEAPQAASEEKEADSPKPGGVSKINVTVTLNEE